MAYRQPELIKAAGMPIFYDAGGVVPPVPAVVPIEPDIPVLPDMPVLPMLPVEPVGPVVPCAEVESTLTESVEVVAESVLADAVFDLHDDSAIPAQIHMPNANFFIW